MAEDNIRWPALLLTTALALNTCYMAILVSKDEYRFQKTMEFRYSGEKDKKDRNLRRVGIPNAPVYKSPGILSQKISLGNYCNLVKVIDDEGNWLKISYKNRKGDDEEGWIYRGHTMGYNGPDTDLEWDTNQADKDLEFLKAHLWDRIEPSPQNWKMREVYRSVIKRAGRHIDYRTINYISELVKSNMGGPGGDPNIVLDGLNTLAELGDLKSLALAVDVLENSSYGLNVCNTIEKFVKKGGRDYKNMAKNAALKISRDPFKRKYWNTDWILNHLR